MLTDTGFGFKGEIAHNYILMTEDEISAALKKMESDPALLTNSAYRANSALFPDNTISFVDTHLAYLKSHPKLDPSQYLSNLRLMIRQR